MPAVISRRMLRSSVPFWRTDDVNLATRERRGPPAMCFPEGTFLLVPPPPCVSCGEGFRRPFCGWCDIPHRRELARRRATREWPDVGPDPFRKWGHGPQSPSRIRAKRLAATLSQRTHFRLQAASSSFWMLRSAAIIPKALLADSWGLPQITAGVNQGGAEIRAMPSAVRLREDYSVQELRALARRSKTSTRADGFCLWPRSGMEWTAERRRRSAEHRHQPIEEARACSACLIERSNPRH